MSIVKTEGFFSYFFFISPKRTEID